MTERAMNEVLKAGHTPGPWTAECEDKRSWAVKSDDYGSVALIHDPYADDFGRWTQLGCNARLIAAAPTMYQELELAADTFRDFSNVLRAISKDVMSAAADIAERHIRECLATIAEPEGRER